MSSTQEGFKSAVKVWEDLKQDWYVYKSLSKESLLQRIEVIIDITPLDEYEDCWFSDMINLQSEQSFIESNIDYTFCREAKLTSVDLLIWLELIDAQVRLTDCVYIENMFGHPFRLVGCDNHLAQIGESLQTFDRWANSVYDEFDLSKKHGRKRFVNWVVKMRGEGKVSSGVDIC